MRTTQQLSITLPVEMADAVKSKVASGEYASESEVIRDGLRTLIARDKVIERWLTEQVEPAYRELRDNPESGLTADQLLANLAARRNKVTKAA